MNGAIAWFWVGIELLWSCLKRGCLTSVVLFGVDCPVCRLVAP